MSSRGRTTFLALVVTQAAHSIEEMVFRLYDVFGPARAASSLVSDDPAVGFAVLNTAFVTFGLWCWATRVRPDRPSAATWVWPWIVIELGNGVVHSTMAIVRGGYFPGVVTAPLLFVLAAALARELRR